MAGQMGVDPFTFIGGSERAGDRTQLVGFLLQVWEVLRDAQWDGLLPNGTAERYGGLLATVEPSLYLVAAQLGQPGIEELLATQGLVGTELEFKLAVFGGAREVLRRVKDAPGEVRDALGRLTDKGRVVAKATGTVLSVTNTVFGSLIPLPGIERLKELKEILHDAVEVSEVTEEADALLGEG